MFVQIEIGCRKKPFQRLKSIYLNDNSTHLSSEICLKVKGILCFAVEEVNYTDVSVILVKFIIAILKTLYRRKDILHELLVGRCNFPLIEMVTGSEY